LLSKEKRLVCSIDVAEELRLTVAFLLVGTNFRKNNAIGEFKNSDAECRNTGGFKNDTESSTFSYSHMGRRSVKNRYKFQGEKIPLADLEIHAQNAEIQGNSKMALKLYEKICKDYKTGSAAPKAYFFRGQWYEKDRQFSIAVKMFTKIAKCFPESPFFT
jgi:hypothetical protein